MLLLRWVSPWEREEAEFHPIDHLQGKKELSEQEIDGAGDSKMRRIRKIEMTEDSWLFCILKV